jgi:hypothetical protein
MLKADEHKTQKSIKWLSFLYLWMQQSDEEKKYTVNKKEKLEMHL